MLLRSQTRPNNCHVTESISSSRFLHYLLSLVPISLISRSDLPHLSSRSLISFTSMPPRRPQARMSTGNVGPRTVEQVSRPIPRGTHKVNASNLLHSGTVEGHSIAWYKFDIVDPVFWHVVRDPPPNGDDEYVSWRKGDKMTVEPSEGSSPIVIPLDKYVRRLFALHAVLMFTFLGPNSPSISGVRGTNFSQRWRPRTPR